MNKNDTFSHSDVQDGQTFCAECSGFLHIVHITNTG